ncbi:MAG: glycosyltransferase family 8 protein [Lachnospiraceae bacterium]|nr:glycosyltransferase family 8 protein [Lachnospiraceae bacterium]
MDIVYASDDNFIRHVAASIYSLFFYNRDEEEINVYILCPGLKEESYAGINKIARKFGRSIEFIQIGNLRERFPFEVDTGGFNINNLSRLFVCSFLPENVDRVFYIDGDTVVTDSLRYLSNIDLGDNLVAMAMEPSVGINIKSGIDFGEDEPYYNAGVLVFDLKRWRQEGIELKLLEYYRDKGGNLFACDQDVINGTFRGKVMLLPPRYNFFSNYKYFRYSALVKKTPAYAAVGKKNFNAAKKNPAIIHFLGDERPWKRGNLNPYRSIYKKFLNKTDWANTPDEPGMEFYLFAFHIMEWITFICPPFRNWLNSRYGMKVISNRKKKSSKKK